MPELTSKEQAEAGLRLLKAAVLQYVRDHPKGVTPAEIREQLGLSSPNQKGDFRDMLLWGIGNLLRTEGLIEQRKIRNRNHLFPCS